MNGIENMVTDRTEFDAAAARAIRDRYAASGDWSGLTAEEHETLERGYYTRHSLNRVEAAVEALSDYLAANGKAVTVSVKTDWAPSDYFTQAELRRYLGNIDALRQRFWALPGMPDTPADIRPWQNANAIEQILANLNSMADMIERSASFLPHAGDAYSGEPLSL